MAWPKGKPRKGHKNKDGSAHKKWGSKVAARTAIFETVRTTTKKQKVEPEEPVQEGPWIKPEWKKLLRWPSGPWVTSCPECTFPEADGGYCPACGWSKSIKEGRVS